MDRLSDSGPKLVEHDLVDIINSDPVMLPITRTGLQQRMGSPESVGVENGHSGAGGVRSGSAEKKMPRFTKSDHGALVEIF